MKKVCLIYSVLLCSTYKIFVNEKIGIALMLIKLNYIFKTMDFLNTINDIDSQFVIIFYLIWFYFTLQMARMLIT